MHGELWSEEDLRRHLGLYQAMGKVSRTRLITLGNTDPTWTVGLGLPSTGERSAVGSLYVQYCTISNDSSPRDFFDSSDKSPKTTKIEIKLLLVSAQVSCDVWLTNHLKLYSIVERTWYAEGSLSRLLRRDTSWRRIRQASGNMYAFCLSHWIQHVDAKL